MLHTTNRRVPTAGTLRYLLIDSVIRLRSQHRIKLADAIIAATAIERGATLIIDDQQLRKLPAVNISATRLTA